MFRKLIIAGATLAALTVPTLAASDWNVIKGNSPATDNQSSACFVADRAPAMGEEKIGGPFKSQALGLDALKKYAACDASNHS